VARSHVLSRALTCSHVVSRKALPLATHMCLPKCLHVSGLILATAGMRTSANEHGESVKY
jgi:hypothetical protein